MDIISQRVGEEPPVLKGENNPASKLNDELVWKI